MGLGRQRRGQGSNRCEGCVLGSWVGLGFGWAGAVVGLTSSPRTLERGVKRRLRVKVVERNDIACKGATVDFTTDAIRAGACIRFVRLGWLWVVHRRKFWCSARPDLDFSTSSWLRQLEQKQHRAAIRGEQIRALGKIRFSDLLTPTRMEWWHKKSSHQKRLLSKQSIRIRGAGRMTRAQS